MGGFWTALGGFDNHFVKCRATGPGVGVYTWSCSVKNRRQLSCRNSAADPLNSNTGPLESEKLP